MLRRARPAAGAPSRSTASSIMAASASSRPACSCRRDHHGQPDLCRRRSARPDFGMGLDGLLTARAPISDGIVNGIDTDDLEPGDRPASRRAPTTRTRSPGAPPTSARCEERFGLERDDGAAVLRGQPADLAEGHGLLAAVARRHRRRRARKLAVLGSGDAGARGRALAAAARHPRPRRRRRSAMTSRCRI